MRGRTQGRRHRGGQRGRAAPAGGGRHGRRRLKSADGAGVGVATGRRPRARATPAAPRQLHHVSCATLDQGCARAPPTPPPHGPPRQLRTTPAARRASCTAAPRPLEDAPRLRRQPPPQRLEAPPQQQVSRAAVAGDDRCVPKLALPNEACCRAQMRDRPHKTHEPRRVSFLLWRAEMDLV